MNDDQIEQSPVKDRKFVEALSRGLDVLRAFSQGAVVMGNQDIARITGLPKPTVSRMTYTLTKLGYLSYSPLLEKYQLDSGVLALGYAYVSNLRVRQLAKPYLDEFARNTNTSVGLTCRDRLSMIYVENCRPSEVTSLRMDVGVRLPLATTAAGRAYLAAMKEEERRHVMSSLASRNPDNWPELEKQLEQAFADYQKYGFCLSLGDWDRNVNAAGVPLHLQDGTPHGPDLRRTDLSGVRGQGQEPAGTSAGHPGPGHRKTGRLIINAPYAPPFSGGHRQRSASFVFCHAKHGFIISLNETHLKGSEEVQHV